MKKFITQEDTSILDTLKKIYPNSSINTLRSILKNKRVTVNNKIVVQANFLTKKGQQICIDSATRTLSNNVEVLYEDNDLLIINKPCMLLSVPLDNKDSINALKILRTHYKTTQIFAVHRLDKDTSGVMVFAKGFNSKKLLDEMFKTHDLKRVYHAIVHGHLKTDKGIWKSQLTENKALKVTSTNPSEKSKLAITHFSVVQKNQTFSYLKLTLQTGRKHQIRVQCKDAGFPIVGDSKYAASLNKNDSKLCLQASVLEFNHPTTNKKLKFKIPIPHHFKKFGFS